VYSFRTAAPAGRSFRFAALGDCGAGTPAQAQIAARIVADRPELVVLTGDIAYDEGSARQLQERFFIPYRQLLARIPFFPCLGNHDVRTRDGAPYLEAFHLPGRERYYSFDWGDVHFVALDSNLPFGPGTAQDRWLASDLAAAGRPWKVVYFHHPPYSSGPHGSSQALRQAWTPLFARHGVQLVLSGHDHIYQRSRPIEGVTYVVTGGGGASLYSVGPAEWSVAAASRHHYLRLEAGPSSLKGEAVDAAGQTFDRFELSR
ncbi:MAG TPA: metallophosphoesterase, partial [Candidatus Nitrosotenuis sp.]|nr:metallophosphoesterase [Candidatus Nitrosotenuis sp.]